MGKPVTRQEGEEMQDRIERLERERADLKEELARRAELLLAYEDEIADLTRALADLSQAHGEAVQTAPGDTAVRAGEARAEEAATGGKPATEAPSLARLRRFLSRGRRRIASRKL